MDKFYHPLTADMAIHLYLDVETLPSFDPDLRAEILYEFEVDESIVKADGRLTDATKIAADVAKKLAVAHETAAAKADEAWRKTAFDGGAGHLASIAWAFDDEQIVASPNGSLTITFDGEGAEIPLEPGNPGIVGDGYQSTFDGRNLAFDVMLAGERQLLIDFFTGIRTGITCAAKRRAEDDWQRLYGHQLRGNTEFDAAEAALDWIEEQVMAYSRKPPVIVAHYADFDIRFVWQRARALGIPVPGWWPINYNRYHSDRVVDTMTLWAGANGRIGLDRLCRSLGIAGKGDIDGSKVLDAIRDGRIEDVVRYNGEDVERVRTIHLRLTDDTELGVNVRTVGDEVDPSDDDPNPESWVSDEVMNAAA